MGITKEHPSPRTERRNSMRLVTRIAAAVSGLVALLVAGGAPFRG